MVKISGGDKLKAALDYIAKGLDKASTLNVGFLEGATYPDGTSVGLVAAVQEFGSPAKGIPARPFMRPLVASKSDEWADAIAKLLVDNDYDAKKTLSQAGEGIKGQVQQAIIDITSPPLSPITLMLRKMKSEDQSLVVTGKTVGIAAAKVAAGESTAGVSTKPLVETGTLLQAVDWEVKE